MYNSGITSTATIKNKSSSKRKQRKPLPPGIQSSKMMIVFEEQLKDTYWAEKTLIKAIPKIIKNASSVKLIAALENHLTETEEQAERVELLFDILGKKPAGNKCEAMEGLIKDVEEIMEDSEAGEMCDVEIITATQKIIRYKIVSYGTLFELAETLGLNDADELLQKTLDEENTAAVIFSEVALSSSIIHEYEAEHGEEESLIKFRR